MFLFVLFLCLFFVLLSRFFGPSSLPSFGYVSCIVLGPPAGHRNTRFFCVFFSSVCLPSSLLFLSCLPSGLMVSSFCWPINWTYHRHIIGLIVPANSNLAPSGLGLRRERTFVLFSFFFSFLFLSVSSIFTLIFSLLSRVFVCTIDMFVLIVLCDCK